MGFSFGFIVFLKVFLDFHLKFKLNLSLSCTAWIPGMVHTATISELALSTACNFHQRYLTCLLPRKVEPEDP